MLYLGCSQSVSTAGVQQLYIAAVSLLHGHLVWELPRGWAAAFSKRHYDLGSFFPKPFLPSSFSQVPAMHHGLRAPLPSSAPSLPFPEWASPALPAPPWCLLPRGPALAQPPQRHCHQRAQHCSCSWQAEHSEEAADEPALSSAVHTAGAGAPPPLLL